MVSNGFLLVISRFRNGYVLSYTRIVARPFKGKGGSPYVSP